MTTPIQRFPSAHQEYMGTAVRVAFLPPSPKIEQDISDLDLEWTFVRESAESAIHKNSCVLLNDLKRICRQFGTIFLLFD